MSMIAKLSGFAPVSSGTPRVGHYRYAHRRQPEIRDEIATYKPEMAQHWKIATLDLISE